MTYTNITIVEREFSDELVELARDKVPDKKDRPIFIYTLILRREEPLTYLVTGDKSLRDAVNSVENAAITVNEALELLRNL